MNIDKLSEYAGKPSLFGKGTSVMWTDPYISQQLLALHLQPEHDIASRNSSKIDVVCDWIVSKKTSRHMSILDLGCGPGLYAERFARMGHTVTGIDFSKNSIEYARKASALNGSNIDYHCKNYLECDFEDQFDLIVLIYLDFCVLHPEERSQVLRNVYRALKKGGMFIFDAVNSRNIGEKILKPSWEVCSPSGFWKNAPYIALAAGYHYPEHKVFVNQHIIIDQTDKVDEYLFWNSYYDSEDLLPILSKEGFSRIKYYDDVLPAGDVWNGDNVTFYTAVKE